MTDHTFQHLQKLEKIQFHVDEHLDEKKGLKLYKTNKILRDIATFMEHPESYSFYKNYMENKQHLHYILLLLKLYDIISNILVKKNIPFNAYHKIFLVYTLLHNPKYSYLIFKYTKNSSSLLLSS